MVAVSRSAVVGLAVFFVLGLVVGTASAGPGRSPKRSTRPAPDRQTVARARQLVDRAQNLRRLRLPLRKRVARRNINRALDRLQQLGVKVDRAVPRVLDSSQEYTLLRQAGALLRGAPKGSNAYALRKQAVTRARVLKRTIYGLPRNMWAYSNGDKGRAELAINLDNPFYSKPAKLLPILAHEYRHIGDIKQALRLEQILKQPELANAAPGSRQAARKQRLQQRVKLLWSHPRAETRAFTAQARAQGLAGAPLGMWWRAPQGGPMDQAYPPARLNSALLKGYFKGISQSISVAMKQATPEKRDLARRYLASYKGVLKQQSGAYFSAVRKDDQRDPGAIERYNATKAKLLTRAASELNAPGPLTRQRAQLAGQTDAYQGTAPNQRVKQILGLATP